MSLYSDIDYVYEWKEKKVRSYKRFRLQRDKVGELKIHLNPHCETPDTTWYAVSRYYHNKSVMPDDYHFRYLPMLDELEVDEQMQRDEIPNKIQKKTREAVTDMVEEIKEKIGEESREEKSENQKVIDEF